MQIVCERNPRLARSLQKIAIIVFFPHEKNEPAFNLVVVEIAEIEIVSLMESIVEEIDSM